MERAVAVRNDMLDNPNNLPLVRDVTVEEREAAIFLIGVNSAFNLRGVPSSCPKKVFFGAVEVALAIAGKVGNTKTVGLLDYPKLKSMVDLANDFGFTSVRSR